MRSLLFSMPDSFEHTPALTMRMPNGALASLAGNAGPGHQVAIADLVLVQDRVAHTVERLMREHDPDLVGLSVMTFQRRTALRLVRLIRAIKPGVTVVAGGYDPSLASEAYEPPSSGVDCVVRGEGEITFRELLRTLSRGGDMAAVPGLSFRPVAGAGFQHVAARPVSRLEDGSLALPDRTARVLGGYTFLGRPIDIVETSRGCTYDCSFCSIIEMRGRNFHTFDFSRVLADISDARARGARAIFLVDDNITLNVTRFEALCRAIVEAGLDDVHYIVQAMTSSIASHGSTLAPLMWRAGFRYVFLGIENILDDDLVFLRASAKNAQRQGGRRTGNATLQAIEALHAAGLSVVGGIIVGNPDDTREAIEANLAFARQHVDWPYIQHPTPYPGTPMTEDFRRRNLIVNDRLEEYDGTTAVVRTAHLEAEEVEFLRWRAERWMKLRHLPVVLRRYPGFVLRHAPRMCAHTFRGSTWRSMLGLESSREVFRRYKQLRAVEREYVPEEVSGGNRIGPRTPAFSSGYGSA
ncbi:MAG: B12-binding domain-containing radical SAM protein [Acidobacteria bacterium]|nr:B12-binding domain-containing radical SAM protein [Acidobacteriota bacterium]